MIVNYLVSDEVQRINIRKYKYYKYINLFEVMQESYKRRFILFSDTIIRSSGEGRLSI